jgi:hypothetical protein
MTPLWFRVQGLGVLKETGRPPADSRPLIEVTALLLPPLVTELHRSFRAWQMAGISPAPVTPDRFWIDPAGGLAVRFESGQHPETLYPVGAQAGLAAWLVLLDKWVETFVVIARARSVWTTGELAGALSFTTPSLLPSALTSQPPDNWARVAVALAQAVADGPLPGLHTDRHWKE